MRIHNRPATIDDFAADLRLLRPWYGDDDALCEVLPKIFARMLTMESVVSRVFEDATVPESPRRISNHLVVYVKPQFADELRQAREPFLGRRIALRFLQDPTVLLDAKGIRRAHEGRGLDLVSMHSTYLETVPGEMGSLEHREEASRNFFHIHRGLRIWQYLRETYSQNAALHDHNAGMRKRCAITRPASIRTPHLYGIDREEALSCPGQMVERIFPEHTPILNLRPLHRELLNRALVGETDEDLAESLGLSVAAIKSRWKAVYLHIEQHCPALLAGWNRNTYAPSARARERRRHLLNYLREHIEELRPI